MYLGKYETRFIDVLFVMILRTGIVSEDMMDEEENVNAIRKLTEEFDEVLCLILVRIKLRCANIVIPYSNGISIREMSR